MSGRVSDETLRSMPLPELDGEVDKNSRGRLLLIGGSVEAPGGILLAALAALRAGAGKVRIATVATHAAAMAVAMPEARVIALPDEGGDIAGGTDRISKESLRTGAIVLGPGMFDTRAAARLVDSLLGRDGPPIVADAAALAHIRDYPGRGRLVLTPHGGEMARMIGSSEDAVAADPATHARQAARDLGAVVALKGAETHIAAPDGRTWLFEGGCVGLATAGSGDVLAGIIGGLLARGADTVTATLWGVHLHGAAGRRLSERVGALGFLARELPGEVPGLLSKQDSAFARRE